LCDALSGTGHRMYLLGAAPGAVDRVVEWIAAHYPDVVVAGYEHGYFSEEEEDEVDRRIRESEADILIVAMGVPRQEVWIHQHLANLDISVAMSFGGLFDYFSGRVPRAPQWVREMGMEWIYRLIQEPRRMWRRYLVGNGVFLYHVLRERFRTRRSGEGTGMRRKGRTDR
jgi:N-acetylglucosaminyldiphosphoundecaprenol N-acetyl-beta-D-mannosaminyltransferase